ncbi:hypothetical protein [Caulobacter sp.]|uniref:hypothetical protein n=1 Tax=Caulobacter sp. TaxID=78 RepID=UPI002B48F79A|nr:hypothetical protein [Caulobacter sp.]HJV41698.1 hypothetical protein [Caulobacter sp.]
MLFHFLYQWASLVALLVTVGAAAWRGAWPERFGAAAMVVAWVASALVYNSILLRGFQVAPMLVDLALTLALLYVALRSDRWWPMWACAFQALNVVLHFALAADDVLWRWAAWLASSCFSYLAMLALLCGALGRPRAPVPTDAASPLT